MTSRCRGCASIHPAINDNITKAAQRPQSPTQLKRVVVSSQYEEKVSAVSEQTRSSFTPGCLCLQEKTLPVKLTHTAAQTGAHRPPRATYTEPVRPLRHVPQAPHRLGVLDMAVPGDLQALAASLLRLSSKPSIALLLEPA